MPSRTTASAGHQKAAVSLARLTWYRYRSYWHRRAGLMILGAEWYRKIRTAGHMNDSRYKCTHLVMQTRPCRYHAQTTCHQSPRRRGRLLYDPRQLPPHDVWPGAVRAPKFAFLGGQRPEDVVGDIGPTQPAAPYA